MTRLAVLPGNGGRTPRGGPYPLGSPCGLASHHMPGGRGRQPVVDTPPGDGGVTPWETRGTPNLATDTTTSPPGDAIAVG